MAGLMTQNGILIRRGDSFDIVMNFKLKNGDPMNIEGVSVFLVIQSSKGEFLHKIAAEIINAEKGTARIKIKPQHTLMDVGFYEVNIKTVLKNGDVHTIFPQDMTANGVFQISEEVTDGRS